MFIILINIVKLFCTGQLISKHFMLFFHLIFHLASPVYGAFFAGTGVPGCCTIAQRLRDVLAYSPARVANPSFEWLLYSARDPALGQTLCSWCEGEALTSF